MKLELRFRYGDDVRAVWLLAVGVLVCGSFYVQTRYQTAISAVHNRTEMLYRRTVVDRRIIQEAASLHEIQARAEHDLIRVSHNASLSATTADLLETLHFSAQSFDTSVLELQPGISQPDPLSSNEATQRSAALQATPITIRVRGRFRNILAFVEDLSHHATLISVSDTEMSLSNDSDQSDTEPLLEATIHATLYRLTMSAHKEVRVATTG